MPTKAPAKRSPGRPKTTVKIADVQRVVDKITVDYFGDTEMRDEILDLLGIDKPEHKIKIVAELTFRRDVDIRDIEDQVDTILAGGNCYDWDNWVDSVDKVTVTK